MVIEELFTTGVMIMGASKSDPARHVGVFRPEAIAHLAEARAAEMEKFRWIAGEWNYENRVPATRVSPSYTDIGSCTFALCEKDTWICTIEPDGRHARQICYDPLSRQWIYVLTAVRMASCVRARDGTVTASSSAGSMTMVGIDCEWRQTWTRRDDDAFGFVNEELLGDTWVYVDEWRFTRK
jgi:hypothetical protein